MAIVFSDDKPTLAAVLGIPPDASDEEAATAAARLVSELVHTRERCVAAERERDDAIHELGHAIDLREDYQRLWDMLRDRLRELNRAHMAHVDDGERLSGELQRLRDGVRRLADELERAGVPGVVVRLRVLLANEREEPGK